MSVFAATTAVSPVHAQQPAAPPAAGNNVDSARQHYDTGLQLFGEENYDAALFEFERAYELAPSFKILYNMARIQRQQSKYAEALRNYQAYLREGGTQVPEDRKAEVEKDIAILRGRVATITVTSKLEGADVYVDDGPICTAATASCVGKTPLPEPLVVNPGRRKLTASKPGYVPATRLVTVVGGDAVTVDMDLTSLDRPNKPVDPGPRNRAIVSWAVTGGFFVGAVVTGVLALKASSDLKDDRNTAFVSADTLDSDSSKTNKFSITTDVLGGIAIVGALVSTYFTVKAFNASSSTNKEKAAVPAAKATFKFGPGGLGGTF